MLFRFSVYGFLRNQRYFEPFLLLYFLERGMTFFEIGLLIAFRELIVNLLEIPSGVAADVFGRRKTLAFSLLIYMVSFFVFGVAESIPVIFGAMFLFAIAESCRSGTHKAMIFHWLRREDAMAEKSKIYGYTRSWSKIGAAASLLIAGGIVLATEDYAATFHFSSVACLAGVVNLVGYPRYLDGEGAAGVSLSSILGQAKQAVKQGYSEPKFRQLILESMGSEGVFQAVKDYLQPLVKAAALPMAAGMLAAMEMSEPQKVVLLAVPVYVLLYLLAAYASRNAHRLVQAAGGEDQAARWVWIATIVVFAVISAAGIFSLTKVMIVLFILLFTLQNIWRPIQISRFQDYGDSQQGAAMLSMENQSCTLTTMLAAPLVGLAVDVVRTQGWGGDFWPVGCIGLCATVGVYLMVRRRLQSASEAPAAAPMGSTPS